MRRLLPVTAMLAAVIASTGAARLSAQSSASASAPPLPEMIPSVIIRAALASMGPMEDEIFHLAVGHPTPGWPTALVLPAGTTVVGGYAFGPFTSIVVSSRRSAGAHVLDPMLRRAHFQPADTTRLRTTEGFARQTSPWGSPPKDATVWCRDSTEAMVIATIDSSGGRRRSNVVLMRGKGLSLPTCGMHVESAMPGRPDAMPLRLPLLAAAPGARVSSTHSGFSDRSISVGAQADTMLSSTALLTHYTAELVRGGWTAVGTPALGTDAAVQSLSARDAHGNPWRGALIITTGAGGRDINIVMSAEAER